MKVKKQGGTAHHAARCSCPRPTKACIRPWALLLKRLGIFLRRKERNPLMTQTEDKTPLSTEDIPLVPIEKIVSLCKRRGFVYPNSEIYGGVSGIYDFGPLGVELRNNIRRYWWWSMVQINDNVVGIEGAIITHPKVWEASGHVENFVDRLVDCKNCKRRFRIDHLPPENVISNRCPVCGGELTEPRKFNLMMETYIGVLEGERIKTYLRGEAS